MLFNHVEYLGNYASETRVITYSILDPETQQFWNHVVCLAPGQGDLFCAGHAWNAAGDLVLAGGTTKHQNPFGGAKLLYVWNPPTSVGAPGTWNLGATLLDDFRWYPSLVVLGPEPGTLEDKIVVLGGSDPLNNQKWNSYQVWRPAGGAAGSWQPAGGPPPRPNTFAGPTVTNSDLQDYPRAAFLSTMEIGTSGMVPISAKVDHFNAPGVWPIPKMAVMGGTATGDYRVYGSSVLFPISPGGGIKNILVAIGGKSSTGILNTYEWSDAGATSPVWFQSPPGSPLNQARWFLNTVLLPDSTIFVLGGEQSYGGFGCSQVPALAPEIFSGSQWSAKLSGTIIRDYHSSALLLPSGKVFTTGGESRHYTTWSNCANRTGRMPSVYPADHQLFVPPYLACGGTRPVIQVAAGSTMTWPYGTLQSFSFPSLPLGISIGKVVVMRPGSVTHHADPNQRCLELPFIVLPDTDPPSGFQAVQVTVPTLASYLLPRGPYMLFLVTNQGVPSTAAWVTVQ